MGSVKQSRAQHQASLIQNEKQKMYRGLALVRLETLSFPYRDAEEVGSQAVQDLTNSFRRTGCLNLDTRYSLHAIIDSSSLETAISSSGVTSQQLLYGAAEDLPRLTFPSDFKLTCLQGWRRVQAAREVLAEEDRCWAVSLYLDESSRDLQTLLADEFFHEHQATDGQIYHKIRLYQLESRYFAATQWWARLTHNKRFELERFWKKETFKGALDQLLDLPGLWRDGIRLGVVKALVDSRLDEPLLHYLSAVKTFWWELMDHDRSSLRKVDPTTVAELELRAPGISWRDADYLGRKLKNGTIFSKFSNEQREAIWKRLAVAPRMVPTLRSFFDDSKYLLSCAACLRPLVHISARETLYTAFANCYNSAGAVQLNDDEEASGVESQYRQLFFFAMLHLDVLSPTSVLLERKRSIRKPRQTLDADAKKQRQLATLAARLGFMNENISFLKAESASWEDSIDGQQNIKTQDDDEDLARRSGRPYAQAQEYCKNYTSYQDIHSSRIKSGILTPFVVWQCKYYNFFGAEPSTGGEDTSVPEAHQTPSSYYDSLHSRNLETPVTIVREDEVEDNLDRRLLQLQAEYEEVLHQGDDVNLPDRFSAHQPQIVDSNEDVVETIGHRHFIPSIVLPRSSFLSYQASVYEQIDLPELFSDKVHLFTWQDEEFLYHTSFNKTDHELLELEAQRQFNQGNFLFDAELASIDSTQCHEAALRCTPHLIVRIPNNNIAVNAHMFQKLGNLIIQMNSQEFNSLPDNRMFT